MFLNLMVSVNEDLLPGNNEPDITTILAFIIIFILFIGTIALAIKWFKRPKLYPIAVIKDENNKIAFAVYQQKKVYKVVNQAQKNLQPATFYDWSDVVSFIKNETKDWDVEVDFLKK